MSILEYHENCYCKTCSLADKVIENLWVGSWHSINDVEYLDERNISRVVTMCDDAKLKLPERITHLQCMVDDDGKKKGWSKCLEDAIDFIHEGLKNNIPTLVHCLCGMNRSVSTVICYLMITRGLTYDEAREFMHKKRTIIYPSKALKLIVETVAKKKLLI